MAALLRLRPRLPVALPPHSSSSLSSFAPGVLARVLWPSELLNESRAIESDGESCSNIPEGFVPSAEPGSNGSSSHEVEAGLSAVLAMRGS